MAADETDRQDRLRFAMLGPLQVWRDGTLLGLGGAQQRAVLAFLLAERERVVSVDQIADALWREHPPAGYAATIQSYVFRLRELLEPGRRRGEQPGVIVTEPGGYRLDVDPDAVDAAVFQRLLESGERFLAAGQPAEGAEDLARALSLWRGSVLADLGGYDFAAHLARRLEELRLRALESRFEADLALGLHGSVIAELTSLAESHPLREHLQAQRLLALYRAGRQADALDAFREVRTQMMDELAIEPGSELVDLHQRILNHDAGLMLGGLDRVARARSEQPTARRVMPAGSKRRVAALAVSAVMLAAVVGSSAGDAPSSALRTMTANSLVRIDGNGSFHDAVLVGVSPDGVALAGRSAWVANTGADTVSKIDLDKHLVVQTTPVGSAPEALAISGSDVWVVNSEASTVSRVNMKTSQVVDTVRVGNQPGAIAVGDSGIWVVNTGDGTVVRIDPTTGETREPIAVGLRPAGIAVDADTVWVSNRGEGTVSPIDVESGILGSSIPVGAGPAGIAATDDAVWVANSLSQTVSRIDPRSRRVVGTTRVGDGPHSIALMGGRLWVSNEFAGSITVIDPANGHVVKEIRTGAAARGLVSDGNATYATTRPLGPAGHSGGTVHITTGFMPNDHGIDPTNADIAFLFTAYSLVYDGLVGVRRTGGSAGLTLVPDLAEDLPRPSADGRDYVFTLRRGIRYSNGAEVKPDDIRRGLQQELTISGDTERLANIVGAPACIRVKTVCDLSRGIEVDDATYRVAFHLREPDPDFLYKLTEPLFATPVGDPGKPASTPRPATGPYMIGEYLEPDRFTLVRNPYFHPWSVAAQPTAYPDEIEWTLQPDATRAVHDVLAGTTDVDQRASSATDYLSLLRAHPENFRSDHMPWTAYLFLNSRVAPFDDPDVRKAVNFAVDRNRIVELVGGESFATPTCQILPPNLPGYRSYCPYTTGPSQAAGYRGPDLVRASALVDRSGTRGMSVTVVSPWDSPEVEASGRYVARVLTRLGYKASFRPTFTDDYFSGANPAQLGVAWWAMDYPTPSNFFEPLRCGADEPGRYCNRAADELFDRARTTQRTDQVRADRVWAALDRTLTDDAARLPLYNQRSTVVVSERVGNFLTNPKYGPLLGQMWVG